MIKKIPMSLTLIKSKDYFENANISLGNILMLPLKIMLISYDPILIVNLLVMRKLD